MKRMREKLHSQSGASILLALLLFLTCCMVAASILAAAASNAGKVRSSRVEQQKHLTLSSAIELVAGEIKQATYTGKYQVTESYTTVTHTETNPDGTTYDYDVTTYYFTCTQVTGDYSCGVKRFGSTKGELTDLITFGGVLDQIFREQFENKGYTPLPDIGDVVTEVILTVETDDLPASTGPEAYAVPTTVTVKVELDRNTHHITLTAWLGDSPEPPDNKEDTMVAELVAKIEDVSGTLQDGNPFVIAYSPGGRSKGTGATKTLDQIYPAPTLRWQLNWIKKGAG